MLPFSLGSVSRDLLDQWRSVQVLRFPAGTRLTLISQPGFYNCLVRIEMPHEARGYRTISMGIPSVTGCPLVVPRATTAFFEMPERICICVRLRVPTCTCLRFKLSPETT